MTWNEEDSKKVEEAILNACENTMYPNGIDELFDGETWVVDFHEIAQDIRDKIQDTWETNGWDTISEKYLKETVVSLISADILAFIDNVYENTGFQLEDNGIKVVKKLDESDKGI